MRLAATALILAAALGGTTACTPTVRVEVAPINIYARLDATVRIRLDEAVQDLIRENPDLF